MNYMAEELSQSIFSFADGKIVVVVRTKKVPVNDPYFVFYSSY
jgi:hypothetical protein